MRYVDIFECEKLSCKECKYRSGEVCSKLSGDKNGNVAVVAISQALIDGDGRLEECPIKRLPTKQTCDYYNFADYTNGVAKGWNDCIDHLTGEGTVK